MRREINETLWQDEFLGWKLRVGNSAVKSTVICFEDTRVRVVQASCDPLSPTPALVFTLRASYTLDADATAACSEDTAWSILWWILNPDGPSNYLIHPRPKEPSEKLPGPGASEDVVPSQGSATSSESRPSTADSVCSRLASAGPGD
ncbi:hypothetical protein VTK56DRAFT_7038 [Thermocarpiscus australiensis]